MSETVLCILSILATVCLSQAYKILLVSPTPSKSHDILNHGLIRYLTDAGHEITYITTYKQKKSRKGLNVIDLSESFPPSEDLVNVRHFVDKKFDIDEDTGFMSMLLDHSKSVLEHPDVHKLMADRSQEFDIIIAEFLLNHAYAGFSGLYNCPLIWFSPIMPQGMLLELIDEAPNPAYNADVLSSSVPPLTFTGRVTQLILIVIRKLCDKFWFSSFDNDVYQKNMAPYIRERRNFVPSFESIKRNTSLVLCNYHTSMGVAVRAPQNFVSIGGFHIEPNVKPLPEDLQRIMDEAEHGVIYFSLGTSMQSKHFPSQIKRDLLTMFGKLNQTVIWKFEEDMSNTPRNVHLMRWAPQQSILAHNNCIIFITHRGLLSTTETIHFGVPIVGIPAFYDQFVNVQRSVILGFARKVDFGYSMATQLELAINELLADPKYSNKIKQLSAIYHDRPVPPGKELVHWVEHVIKTRGAPHLRSPAFLMPWYQKMYLDLVLAVLIPLLMLKYVFQLRYTKIKIIVHEKQK